MHNTKVKICGITNFEDAKAAVDMGADMLGFNFYKKSPRYIEPTEAGDIISRIQAFVETAGIFVNETADDIIQISTDIELDWVQLHGDESPGFCSSLESLPAKIIKAIRVRDSRDIDFARNFSVDAFLFDAYQKNRYGGTGKRLNWEELPEMIGDMYDRIFLAGGITPKHVQRAMELDVYGIDICSGIEAEPGKKDHKKMKELFDNINQLRR